MAVYWLLIAIVGLEAIELSYQAPEDNFANPPPLPTAGMLLYILKIPTINWEFFDDKSFIRGSFMLINVCTVEPSIAYFVRLIFILLNDYENILTKISQFTVYS